MNLRAIAATSAFVFLAGCASTITKLEDRVIRYDWCKTQKDRVFADEILRRNEFVLPDSVFYYGVQAYRTDAGKEHIAAIRVYKTLKRKGTFTGKRKDEFKEHLKRLKIYTPKKFKKYCRIISKEDNIVLKYSDLSIAFIEHERLHNEIDDLKRSEKKLIKIAHKELIEKKGICGILKKCKNHIAYDIENNWEEFLPYTVNGVYVDGFEKMLGKEYPAVYSIYERILKNVKEEKDVLDKIALKESFQGN